MGECCVLNAQKKLRRASPTLVAFKSVFRVKCRHHVPHLHQASQDVESVVRRCHQLHVFDHSPRTTSPQLEKIGLVAIAKLGPPEVGASMSDRHMSEDS